ncbi:MAG: glycosyltransferase [Candidatus Limnocylindria bacterium]
MSAPPTISVVIPTLNAERLLGECLDAVLTQDWPREGLEVLLIDAGSTDRTLSIARSRGVDRVLENPLKTAEAGKAVGVRAACGDLLLLLDSDNVLTGTDWLRRMTAPFADADVLGAEPMRWDYAGARGVINRWHALSGVADPVSLYVGNYCRDSLVTGRWTDLPHRCESRDGWDRIELEPDSVPVFGANGFMIRRSVLGSVTFGEYYFDLDQVHDLVSAGHRIVARVDVAIRHDFCEDVAGYVRKTRRRADDFFFFSSQGQRSYPWTAQRKLGLLRFVASTVLVVPLMADVVRGWRRQPDPAWLFHVPACLIALYVYGAATVRGRLAPRAMDRTGWRQ